MWLTMDPESPSLYMITADFHRKPHQHLTRMRSQPLRLPSGHAQMLRAIVLQKQCMYNMVPNSMRARVKKLSLINLEIQSGWQTHLAKPTRLSLKGFMSRYGDMMAAVVGLPSIVAISRLRVIFFTVFLSLNFFLVV